MMNVDTLTSTLSKQLGFSKSELIYKSLLAYIYKEISEAEAEIGAIRERYTVLSFDELYQAISDGSVPEHPSWEDYIIWKNKVAHINHLRQLIMG